MFHVLEEKRFDSACRRGEYLDYLSYVPKDAAEPLPLLVYIHGAGSRGHSLDQMGVVGPIKLIEEGKPFPAMLAAPQCHEDHWFDLFETLAEFIDAMRHDPRVDARRVYVTGGSMGGFTSWQMACAHPDWFAAAVPVCGGGQEWFAGRLKGMPIWAFHGLLDPVVPVEESVRMARAAQRAGADVRLTIYPDVHHEAWERAYADDAMWAWLFAQARKPGE